MGCKYLELNHNGNKYGINVYKNGYDLSGEDDVVDSDNIPLTIDIVKDLYSNYINLGVGFEK